MDMFYWGIWICFTGDSMFCFNIRLTFAEKLSRLEKKAIQFVTQIYAIIIFPLLFSFR